jgi:hypothetical protein
MYEILQGRVMGDRRRRWQHAYAPHLFDRLRAHRGRLHGRITKKSDELAPPHDQPQAQEMAA